MMHDSAVDTVEGGKAGRRMRNLRCEALVTVHTLTAVLPVANRRDITVFVSIGSVVMMSSGGVAKLLGL